ncbi:MAG: LysR family transcriptional regulator [Lysobacter sp.]|nr:LysR family transcriptional regulator [Lysobacter sp.]
MTSVDLDLLRTFLAVAERGSFSAAAARVWRTQAAVSQQIQRLEAQLGEPLFLRSSRSVRLSAAGERLLGYARRLLQLSDEAVQAVRDARTRTVLRIGTTDDIAAHALMPVLADLGARRQELQFEVLTAPTRELLSRLGGGCDLVVCLGLPNSGAGRRLAMLPLRWVGRWPGTGPVPLALHAEGCLMRGQALAALDQAGVAWEVATSASGAATVEAAARAGLAVGVVVGGLAAADLPRPARLPALPKVEVRLHAALQAEPVVAELAALLARRLKAGLRRAA